MNIVLLFLWHLALCLRVQAEYSSTSPPPAYSEALDNGTFGYYPVRTYATAEDITSPSTNFLQWNDECEDGLHYFLTPRGWSLPNPGPMILDDRGELVWSAHFDNTFGGQAYDFTVQSYQGEKYMTFWLGDDRVRGHGSGYYYMLNSSYDIVHKVGAANGLSADLHEFLITPQGTALMTMYQVVSHDVSEFRDFDPENPDDEDPNYIWDCVFQEVSVETGDLVFEWRASDHVSINETYHGIGGGGTKNDPFDWFHINSIEKDELGNYLISARYTHTITYIDGTTGDIIWTLGGARNDFLDLSNGFGINFAWQHDARFIPADSFPNMYTPPADKLGYATKLLTLFDNAAEDQHYEYGLEYSRGLLLEISYPLDRAAEYAPSVSYAHTDARQGDSEMDVDLNLLKVQEINGTDPAYTVRVIKAYLNPSGVRSSSQGSMQIIPQEGRDSKVLVGYGLNAVFTEYAADGSVLCDAHFGANTSWERGDIQSYRVYKFPWTARPESRPAVEISDDDVEVYVSWNGATDVRDWVLQCSETDAPDDEQAWADVLRMQKQGFETIIPIPSDTINSLGSESQSSAPRYLRVIALGEAGRRLEYGASAVIDRGLMASYYPLLVDEDQPATSISPIRIFMALVCATSAAFIAYEIWRWLLSRRLGRPGGGPLRWREWKGGLAGYRLLGGEV